VKYLSLEEHFRAPLTTNDALGNQQASYNIFEAKWIRYLCLWQSLAACSLKLR